MSSAAKKGTKRPRPRPAARRPSLSDESDDGAIDDLDLTDNNNNRQRDDEEKDAKELETPAQKRLRLARSYLAQVSDDLKKKAAAKPVEVAEGVYEFSAEDVDRELIAERLVQDQLEASGRAFHRVADALVRRKDPVKAELDIAEGNLRIFGGRTGHRLAVTGLAIATPKAVATAGAAGAAGGGGARQPVYLYSVSKDASIIKWDFYSGKEVQVIKGELKRTKKRKRIDKGRKKEKDPNQGPIQGHTDEIWAIAVSSDGRFLATGSKSSHIKVHSISPEASTQDKLLHTFSQHRAAISGLAFRIGTSDLYSASQDRTVKVWNADAGAYVETLFGHQDPINTISANQRERCLTPGSRDRTLRLWKIPEESQLVFRLSNTGDYGEQLDGLITDEGIGKRARKEERKPQGGSIECSDMVDEEWFISGSDVGSISLWHATKKKPVYTRLAAHQSSDPAEPPVWISALASLRHTDLFASGSSDGFVRLWKIGNDMRSFKLQAEWAVKGVVNALAFFEGPDWDTKDNESEAQAESVNRRERARMVKAAEKFVYLAVAVGDEHRLGRWFACPARNRVLVVKLGKRE